MSPYKEYIIDIPKPNKLLSFLCFQKIAHYPCIFMDKFDRDFLKTQKLQPFVWFRYIDDVFFIWTHGKEELTFPKLKVVIGENKFCHFNEHISRYLFVLPTIKCIFKSLKTSITRYVWIQA